MAKISLNCKTCNKKFSVSPYKLIQGKKFTAKYCSRKCQEIGRIIIINAHILKEMLDQKIKMSKIAQFFKIRKETIYQKMKELGIKPNRRPGYSITPAGYKLVKVPNHPYANKQGYVREHRLIMETQLGRYLEPNEAIDHINENKLDNRIENLRLCTTGQNTKWWQEKHGNPFQGKKHSEETKKKISQNHPDFSGKNHPMFGKHLSIETRKKISETKKRRNLEFQNYI